MIPTLAYAALLTVCVASLTVLRDDHTGSHKSKANVPKIVMFHYKQIHATECRASGASDVLLPVQTWHHSCPDDGNEQKIC